MDIQTDYSLFGAALCLLLQFAIILILLEQRRRKRAEEQALRASESLYRLFMENADDLFMHHTADGSILYVSPVCRDLFGYEPGELLGQSIESFIHPDDLAKAWDEVYEIVAAGGEHYIAQSRLRHKMGHWIWAETKGRIVYTSNGEFAEVYCLVRDITERKQAENALRESEKKFRTLFRLIPVGISVSVFHDGTLLEVNETFLRIAGYTRDELIGKTSTELRFWVSPAGRAQFIEPLRQQGFVRDLAIEVRTKSGTILQTLFSSEIMKIGKQQCLISAFMDISELKRIEQELRSYQKKLEELVEERTLKLQHEIESRKRTELSLRESEEKYRLIAENATDVIWTTDNTGRFTYISPSIQRLSGYTAEEVMQLTVQQCLTKSSWELISNLLQKEQTEKQGTLRFEVEQMCKNGSTVWVEVIVERFYDHMGEHIGSLGISRDIRQRKQMEKALQQAKEAAEAANSAKSMFLSSMSHELRTPLNAILGFAQLLSREPALSDVQREYLGIINRSGEHLLKLINDVLDMSKIEAGRMTVKHDLFDLWRMLTEIEEMIRIRAKQRDLQFYVERSPGLPRSIVTDESKLRQILINLLGNAVKFTEQGHIVLTVKELTVASAGAEDFALQPSTVTLQFSIADTGPGIAADELSAIFTPFHQASGAREKEGSGLGLALSLKFVQLLGGDIQVQSEVGQGSHFTATVQAELAPHDEAAFSSPNRTISGLAPQQTPARILVVDDHSESRQLLSVLLGDIGFEIKEANNGQEALELVEQWQPQLILMNMLMPVMDGYEATKKIRSMETHHHKFGTQQHIPIIALTAYVFEEEQQKILDAGCDAILLKPADQSRLFELIRIYLDIRYEYTDDESPAHEDPRANQQITSLTPENLADLPGELIEALEQAVIEGNQYIVMQAVEAVRAANTELAEKIARLAQDFKYQSIWNMIQQMKAKR